MKPSEVYNLIEDIWKESAVQTMALELIVSGAQPPNPQAFTFANQHETWNRTTGRLRLVLDELEKIGKAGEAQS